MLLVEIDMWLPNNVGNVGVSHISHIPAFYLNNLLLSFTKSFNTIFLFLPLAYDLSAKSRLHHGLLHPPSQEYLQVHI